MGGGGEDEDPDPALLLPELRPGWSSPGSPFHSGIFNPYLTSKCMSTWNRLLSLWSLSCLQDPGSRWSPVPQHPSPISSLPRVMTTLRRTWSALALVLYPAVFQMLCLITQIFKTPSEVDVIIIPILDGETEVQGGGELTQGHRAELKDPEIKPQESDSSVYYSFESYQPVSISHLVPGSQITAEMIMTTNTYVAPTACQAMLTYFIMAPVC